MESAKSQQALTTETNASIRVAVINEMITGPPATAMLRESGLLDDYSTSTRKVKLLDNASGIGTLLSALSTELQENGGGLDLVHVIGGDIDDTYLDYLRKRTAEWQFPVEVMHLDQQSPELESNSLTHIFNNFGIMFAPDGALVLNETYRMLSSGGVAAFSSWNKVTWWDEILVPAFTSTVPDAPPLPHPMDMFRKLGWTEAESTEEKLKRAGFVGVQSTMYAFGVDVDPEDFAMACAHLVKAMSARAWTEEARAKYEPMIEQAILDYLRSTFEEGRWPGKMSALLTWGAKK